MPYGQFFTLAPNNKMLFNNIKEEAFVILMALGCFSVCHRDTGLHIGTSFAPTIIGLIDGYSIFYNVKQRPQHCIQAETPCSGWLIPLNIFVEKCDELNLWHDIAKVLAQRLMIMSTRDNELVGNDIYKKIKILLTELWLYPEEIRNQITVASFIHRRTRVSKSRIMGILAELKKGNYIQTKNGVLISVTKLPESF